MLKNCAALDMSTVARWEPTVQIPIVWDYEVRGAPDFRGKGRRYAVMFRWLWAMRKTIEQGFTMTILLANLRRNASLQRSLLIELQIGSKAGGPKITINDVIEFVANPQNFTSRTALIEHVYWTHSGNSYDAKSNATLLVTCDECNMELPRTKNSTFKKNADSF